MLDTALSLDYDEIRAQVTDLMHGSRAVDNLSKEQRDRIDAVMRSGLRKFYFPPPVEGVPVDWSFMRPTLDFTVDTTTADYDLPPDFGGFIGELYHDPTDNVYLPLRKVTPNEIIKRRMPSSTYSGYPVVYAERPKATGGITNQRWQLMIWPQPNASYTLRGTYRIHPHALNSLQGQPYGGVEHAQTILEACLAEAEIVDQIDGPHKAAFADCLMASVQVDRRNHMPDYLGYNGNRRGVPPYLRRGDAYENFTAWRWQEQS